jgi:hypothetical protein
VSIKSENQKGLQKEDKSNICIFKSQPQGSTFSEPKERSHKSVFEKYNIPETISATKKCNRVSIQSKISNGNSKKTRESKDVILKIKNNEMHKSGNTIKKMSQGKIRASGDNFQNKLEKWGFNQVESRELNQELFRKKEDRAWGVHQIGSKRSEGEFLI